MIESFLELADVKIIELPGVTQLVGGGQVSDIREVDIIDF